MPFVLDASVALAWFFQDETTAFSESVLERLNDDRAVTPAIWPLEVANVISLAERRGRTTTAKSREFTRVLTSLPIDVAPIVLDDALGRVLDLARAHQITSYDAAYLVLAIREGLPIATLDSRIRAVAETVGVAVVE